MAGVFFGLPGLQQVGCGKREAKGGKDADKKPFVK